MKYLLIILLIFLTGETLAQDTTEVKIHNSVLKLGEMLNFGDSSIKFKEVISDSRCPIGVTCIWAGEAVVRVELYKNGIFQKEKIETVGGGKIPLDLLAEEISYNLNGLILLPYPKVETTEKHDPYSLHIQISKISDSLN
ncbi:hypothetical protein LZ575_15905 [Antarcticibacterium sp. 1MA-6-2]|uniref:hypothetical protein n=1 Tax=Antarcticibacterium sp. 1MA-6-2 TaxID=2908210 RepID=UPI001F347C59|nr:hypothetical protein [Antarcticibacterium sp. 1MA-6-2]UJH90323.1 hypothetical protein LZ575_15905 [Antarcticibacterium sp. 1MA-6-2]